MNDMHQTMVSRVRMDTDGYLVDADEWSEALAIDVANAAGIDELSSTHWKVIRALRAQYIKGHPDMFPEIRHFCAGLGLDSGCVDALFGDPVIAWQIAGLPRSGIDMSAYMPDSHLL
jgi:TusE/DsrC/DsvC family sulfur relay protein